MRVEESEETCELIRPDGYVAWVGAEGLDAALAEWFGPPTLVVVSA